MRKLFGILAILLASSVAHAACTVSGVYVMSGGTYSSVSGFTITISGPGSGGATANPNFVYVGGGGSYLYLSSVTVGNGGSFTGPATVTFSGGTPGAPSFSTATGYAVMSGSCGSGGGGGNRKVSSWLM